MTLKQFDYRVLQAWWEVWWIPSTSLLVLTYGAVVLAYELPDRFHPWVPYSCVTLINYLAIPFLILTFNPFLSVRSGEVGEDRARATVGELYFVGFLAALILSLIPNLCISVLNHFSPSYDFRVLEGQVLRLILNLSSAAVIIGIGVLIALRYRKLSLHKQFPILLGSLVGVLCLGLLLALTETVLSGRPLNLEGFAQAGRASHFLNTLAQFLVAWLLYRLSWKDATQMSAARKPSSEPC